MYLVTPNTALPYFFIHIILTYMKKLIILAALVLPLGLAHAAYYLEIEGVEGESSEVKSQSTSTQTSGSAATLNIAGSVKIATTSAKGVVGTAFVLDGTKSQDDSTVSRFLWRQVSGPTAIIVNSTSLKASVTPKTAGTYVFELSVTDASGRSSVKQRSEFIVVSGTTSGGATLTTKPQAAASGTSSGTSKGGNVEYEWKVEEGEKAPGIEPDDIDSADDGEPLTPDFSILLGGGGSGDDEERAEGLERARQVLEVNAKASEQAIESISMNFEKITTRYRQSVKLFGFIPMTAMATVEIDAEQNVKVKFPWWGFLASGKDNENVGQKVFSAISNVLKTKHDTVKNAIGNIR